VYSHGVGTSEDAIALSSKSLEIFFSWSSDRNAAIFAENVAREEYDVKKLKMTDRWTTDEKPWSLARCDAIDSYVWQ
jgi:hypothetical protein